MSTVWEILKQEGLDPAPERASTTWADFLRSQADALLTQGGVRLARSRTDVARRLLSPERLGVRLAAVLGGGSAAAAIQAVGLPPKARWE